MMETFKEIMIVTGLIIALLIVGLFGFIGCVLIVLVIHPFTYIAIAVMFAAWMIWGGQQ